MPVDRELGLLPKEHATAGSREKMALLGATESYAEAALKLEKIAGLKACPKEIQRIAVREGRRAEELLARQETEARSPAPGAAKSTENHHTVVLEMDGTCVLKQPSGPRKKSAAETLLAAARALASKAPTEEPAPQRCRGREVKCATVFGLDQRLAKPSRPTLAARRYTATARGIEAFAASVYALLLAYGGARARRIAVLGDGAEWIWNWVRDWLHPWTEQRAEIVEIVDFWHAAERLATVAKALFGEGTEEAKQWLATWRHRLHEGEIDALLAKMQSLAARWKSGRRRQTCLEQLRYFGEHRERMRYEKFRAMNLPIGSGAIEGTCKCLIKKRMATSGMHWGEEQIEPLVALRTVLFNQDWELLYNETAA